MQYLHFYENESDYARERSGNYKEPWVSCHKTNNYDEFNEQIEPVNYNKKESPVAAPPTIIWIDDFDSYGDGPEYIAEDRGYASFEKYMEAYLSDPANLGSNCFVYQEETLEFEGNTYYLYELNGVEGAYCVKYGLLPMNYSYDYLYLRSMETDYTHRFEPFTYILGSDNEVYWHNPSQGAASYVLVKVEE